MNLERFSSAQASQIHAMLDHIDRQMRVLTNQERIVYTSLWTLIARSNVPVAISGLRLRGVGNISPVINHLAGQGLVWYDSQMRAVLQCSPFSALKTGHRVKTFGWKAAYVCDFISAPLALLLYGPNTWLEVRSLCRHNAATLAYRVQLDQQHHLMAEVPSEATNWRVWIPDGSLQQLPGQRETEPSVFFTPAELATHRHDHPDQAGVAYSFDEAITLSECLLHLYKQALSD